MSITTTSVDLHKVQLIQGQNRLTTKRNTIIPRKRFVCSTSITQLAVNVLRNEGKEINLEPNIAMEIKVCDKITKSILKSVIVAEFQSSSFFLL